MKPWRHPLFWLAALLTLGALSAVGVLLARWLVPAPPTYHRNSYFEFALPAGWSCERAGTETVCRPPGAPPHDAIIILTAKHRGASDSLQAYLEHLSRPIPRTDGDRQVPSRVEAARTRTIGRFEWADGLHYESELPAYFTRYLGTVTAQLGVLITFSAHRSVADERLKELERCVQSLRIHQQPV